MASLPAPLSLMAQARYAMRARLTRRATVRRTYSELSVLSDVELARLGLHRADIWSVALSSAR